MDKSTLLAEAAALGNVQQVKSYLLSGTDPNAFASETSHRYNTVRKHGVHYETPLVAAADNGSLAVVKILIEHNADVNLAGRIRHGAGSGLATPLEVAIEGNYPEVVKELVFHRAVWQYKRDSSSTSPLFYAIDKKHTSLALWLLGSGLCGDAELLHGPGTSPLEWAINQKQFSVAKKLIELGVDVKHIDPNGNTALHAAALAVPPDSEELIEILLEAGANVNASDDEWKTPLHYAVQWNRPQNVETLLRHGADIDPRDKPGFTPLLLALLMQGDRSEIVKILLQYGADTYIPNKSHDRLNGGKDALQMAELCGEEVAAIVRRHREQE